MNKFLLRIILFFFLVLLFFLFLRTALPYYWGSPVFHQKIDYLENEGNNIYDIYFVGASTVYRHIIPTIFDESIGGDLHSFNLSADGSFHQHDIYIFNNYIDKKEDIKYVFFELNSLDNLKGKRYQTTYSKYYLSVGNVFDAVNYFSDSNYDEVKKKKIIKRYIMSYLENFFFLRERSDLIDFFKNYYQPQKWALGKKLDGYAPLPEKKKKDRSYLPGYLNRIKRRKLEASRSEFKKYNKNLYNIITNNISNLKEKGIHAIYILPPNQFHIDSDSEMINLFRLLPNSHKIDLSNPMKFSEFYNAELRVDYGHFRPNGAELYTKKLAKEFKKILLIN